MCLIIGRQRASTGRLGKRGEKGKSGSRIGRWKRNEEGKKE
jgi:hypothetical protein